MIPPTGCLKPGTRPQETKPRDPAGALASWSGLCREPWCHTAGWSLQRVSKDGDGVGRKEVMEGREVKRGLGREAGWPERKGVPRGEG